ncbi:MAG: hypothetical protein ACRCUT_04205 [Spirochaetota bacterium]
MAHIILNPALLSISGRFGSLVYYQSHSRQFARRYVVPRNPGTSAQRICRNRFAQAVKHWQNLPDSKKELWRRKARSVNQTGYTLFIRAFLADSVSSDKLLLHTRFYPSPFQRRSRVRCSRMRLIRTPFSRHPGNYLRSPP